MKSIIRAIYEHCGSMLGLLFLLLGGLLQGQERPDAGQVAFVRMVNLVSPGEGNLKIEIDGEDPWPVGYRLGQRTGGVGMKAGQRKFVMRKKGCLTAKREIDLVGGKTITLAIYAEAVVDEETGKPLLDVAGKVAHWQIKVAQLSQVDPGGDFHLTFVSFCPEESLDVEVRPAKAESFFVVAKRRQAIKRKFASERERVAIVHEEKVLNMLKGRNKGNYVVMIYEGEEGKEALSFYDPKFVLAH